MQLIESSVVGDASVPLAGGSSDGISSGRRKKDRDGAWESREYGDLWFGMQNRVVHLKLDTSSAVAKYHQ